MERLKELREARNMNQQKLAAKLSTSQATISKYELGLSEPDIAMIVAMAEYFGVSTDYLLGKYRIRHLLQRNGPACKGRQNGNTSVSAFIAAHLI